MAEVCDFYTGEVSKFHDVSAKLFRTVYNDSDEYRLELNRLLDVANSLEYSLKFVPEETAGRLLEQCCYLVHPDWDHCVVKLSLLVSNLVNKQQIVLRSNLSTVCEYFIKVLHKCKPWMYTDVLRVLAIIFYENIGHLTKYEEELVGGSSAKLIQLCLAQDEDVVRAAVQCIENLCIRTSADIPYLNEDSQLACFQCLVSILQRPRPPNMELASHLKLLQSTFKALQNLMLGTKSLPVPDQLGAMLAAIKLFMLSGVPGFTNTVPPASLNPTPLGLFDGSLPKPQPVHETPRNPSSSAAKKSRKRKTRDKKTGNEGADDEGVVQGMERLTVGSESQGATASSISDTSSNFLQSMSRMSSSESEFSDTEGGQTNRLRSLHSRLRHCALVCFVALVKVVDRRVMFGYWNSFLPDVPGIGGPPTSPTLFTAIMKDSSPKVRTVAVAVLSGMLESSKQFLHAAEDSDQYRNAPFTPFSVTLGYMVKEIHRCLLLALVAETSPHTTLQIIKCLGILIPNVPYHRLKPGLLSRVVKQIKTYINHRDPNIRVACLTCLGSIAAAQAPVLEVSHILLSTRPSTSHPSESQGQGDISAMSMDRDLGYTTVSPGTATPPTPASGLATPPTPSGTPASEQENSWVVRLCMKNVAPHLLEVDSSGGGRRGKVEEPQPLPIRLESLQLLSQLAKAYFSVIRSWLGTMCDLVQLCLRDQEPAVQLHGAKLLEQMSSSFINPKQSEQPSDLDETMLAGSSSEPDQAVIDQMLQLWLPLLKDPIPHVIQTATYAAVKYTLCDCLANTGPHVFISLPMDKRVLCITLLLGLTGDGDHHVRAAAVRALGVYVRYPCLREDVSFVADTANMIITGLAESSILVRVKAAWALGNLTDAIVLNRMENDTTFLEEFSDMLLLKLFEVGTRASSDSDKVRCNAVRALGNLMLYIHPQTTHKGVRFDQAVASTMQSLVKNISTGNMKVRWNACYAVGKMFRNPHLSLAISPWTKQLHTALASVIQDCKNFKVRINAAMALSLPTDRGYYGDSALFGIIWNSLMKSLTAADTITELAELKYRDSLTEQVCSTLIHLVSLLIDEDLSQVATVGSLEVISPYMNKYILHLSESNASNQDKAAELSKAQEHLLNLLSQASNEKCKATLLSLQSLLTLHEIVIDDAAGTETVSPMAKFAQTYD